MPFITANLQELAYIGSTHGGLWAHSVLSNCCGIEAVLGRGLSHNKFPSLSLHISQFYQPPWETVSDIDYFSYRPTFFLLVASESR